ncbi:MAG: hypothetical protein EAY81_12300 [Bacteroidetes bacterium]|nr:MAG: hypothetical protein EAY81_12300 [Bacteroidota bacterium]
MFDNLATLIILVHNNWFLWLHDEKTGIYLHMIGKNRYKYLFYKLVISMPMLNLYLHQLCSSQKRIGK